MTDDYGDENLITQTEIFLNEVLTTWSDTMNALESCEEVYIDPKELDLISGCIDSLAVKAYAGPNANNMHNPCIDSLTDNWWYQDVPFLNLHLYKCAIQQWKPTR
ncbi:putative NPH3/RPT2-like family protein [Helianthus debilis subsp. tardiflorus]